jgi:hypothetical protein
MRYQPGLFGHLPEWETSDRDKDPRTGLSELGDRVDHRPTRVRVTPWRKRRSR